MDLRTVEQKLTIGMYLIKNGYRGIFKWALPFYTDTDAFSCSHVAPLFQAVPRDWFDETWDTRLESWRFVRQATDFDIMHADARCDDCQHHAVVMASSGLCAEWKLNKLKEIGFLKPIKSTR